MKNRGLGDSFIPERDDDLIRAYEEEIKHGGYRGIDVIMEIVVNSPTKRFWITPERIIEVVRLKRNGKLKLENYTHTKRAMYTELLSRFKKVETAHPEWMDIDKAIEVVYQPAPSFYITPQSAKVILCKRRKQRQKKRLAYIIG